VDGFLGDIAISVETARRNARHYRRSLDRELRILILHGILHLMGYDHETDRGQMNQLEGRLRRRLGLS
jgi:probable rRNA maturation factor